MWPVQFSSVQSLIMYDFLWLHGLQYSRLPCPSPTPGAYSNSCQLSRWCHPTISSSVIPFSSHLESFSASGSFQMSQFFSSSGQSIGVSASSSFLPMNIQDWLSLGLTGLIPWQSKGLYQIPYDYTVEVTNRFNGLDLIERVPKELWTEVCDTVQEVVIKTIPQKKKCKKAK